MKAIVHLLLLVVSQATPPLAMWWISVASYEPRSITTGTEDWLTIATMLVGASGLALGGRGIYLTILRVRPWVAGLLTLLVWTPLVLSAAVYAYAILVFRF